MCCCRGPGANGPPASRPSACPEATFDADAGMGHLRQAASFAARSRASCCAIHGAVSRITSRPWPPFGTNGRDMRRPHRTSTATGAPARSVRVLPRLGQPAGPGSRRAGRRTLLIQDFACTAPALEDPQSWRTAAGAEHRLDAGLAHRARDLAYCPAPAMNQRTGDHPARQPAPILAGSVSASEASTCFSDPVMPRRQQAFGGQRLQPLDHHAAAHLHRGGAADLRREGGEPHAKGRRSTKSAVCGGRPAASGERMPCGGTLVITAAST